MKSLYQAYQAYERRVERGELFPLRPARSHLTPASHEPLLVLFGDLLIQAGLKLKRRYAAGKPMAWSPMTGSRQ